MYNVISTTTQNLSDPDFGLLKSLKVKYDGTIGLPMHDFLLDV